MKILLDAMGGDNAPNAVLQGAAQAAQEFGQGMTIALLGPAETLKKAAAELSIDLAPFELIDCPEVITMEDDPVKAARQKKDSSMIRGLTMLKNGEADAFVSAGSTGALHVATSLIVRTLKGIKRPALAAQIPTLKQPFLLLDCGANAECRADMINTFGTMGSVYAQQIMGRAVPAVALVNNGAEDHKGTPLYREAHERLKTNPSIHFAGNIEPRDLLKGDADVVVCDGFVGNVHPQADRGRRRCAAVHAQAGLPQKHRHQARVSHGQGRLQGNLKKMMDSEEVGGAPLLGAAKPVIKAPRFQQGQGHQERHPPGAPVRGKNDL